MRIYLSDLSGDHLKIMQLLDNFKETVDALEQTNSQLLNAKTNRVMQRFTVLAFLTYPIVILTSFFNASIIDNLISHNPIIFGGISFAVILVTGGLLVFFRKKGWI